MNDKVSSKVKFDEGFGIKTLKLSLAVNFMQINQLLTQLWALEDFELFGKSSKLAMTSQSFHSHDEVVEASAHTLTIDLI